VLYTNIKLKNRNYAFIDKFYHCDKKENVFHGEEKLLDLALCRL
jgi:hypothetical protein